MKSFLGSALAAIAISFALGCGGAASSLLNSINPFAGTYSGTVTFTNSSTSEPLSLTVTGAGHVTGTYVDPSTSNSTLDGNVDSNGKITGTTVSGATHGTFSLTIGSAGGNTFTGTGTLTVNSPDEPVTFSVSKLSTPVH